MKLLNRYFPILLFLTLCTLPPASLFAQTMEQAVRSVVSELGSAGLSQRPEAEIIIEMVNYHSRNFDREARAIQGELYAAIQSRFPSNRILLKEEAIAGISSRAVMIKGTYKPEGNQTTITLTAVTQMNGQMIANASAVFMAQKEKFENLVVVLPLEATVLPKNVTGTYSKILRSALTQTGFFNLVSSDIVDAVDADEIQEQYACTREECSAIVAEQVNANQVITTQYTKITAGSFYLTASLKDIQTGRTINEVAIQHDGNLKTLPKLLNQLAFKLAGVTDNRSGKQSGDKTGMLVIKSSPSQAHIMLDGRLLSQKTDTLLQNIPIGKHIVTIYTGRLGSRKKVIIVPNKAELLDLDLQPLKSEITIHTTPTAAIYIDGKRVADTPGNIALTIGEHRLELKKQGYLNLKKNIILKPFQTHQVFDFQLERMRSLSFSVTPSAAWIKLDGKEIKSEETLTLDNQHSKHTEKIPLPEGKHTLEVGHSHVMKNEKRTVEIRGEKQNQETVMLTPDELYLERLKEDQNRKRYQSDLRNWRWKWGIALAGSGLAAFYAYQENQASQNASDKQRSYEDAILTSFSSAEGAKNRDAANAENENVKRHNANVKTGTVLSVALLGLATWIWLDEPENRVTAAWQPLLKPNGDMVITYNVRF